MQNIYTRELGLAEGFTIAAMPKKQRIAHGKEVSVCSGIALFESLKDNPIHCYACGMVADRWVLERGVNQLPAHGKPVMNLYGVGANGRLLMMTRDHIIPKSLGGVDHILNLRPACDECNGKRGNILRGADKKFMAEHPELIDMNRVHAGRAHVFGQISNMKYPMPSEIIKMMKPFYEAQKIIDRQRSTVV